MSEPISAARERLLAVAERLFGEKGYDSVSMRDIADALEIKQASLYHHFPKGKKQLYVAVMSRIMEQHRAALERVIEQAGIDMEAQLKAAASWLLAHPPLDLPRMVFGDLPKLQDAELSKQLTGTTYQALLMPLARVFHAARERGEHSFQPDALLAGSFLALMDGIHVGATFANMQKLHMANLLVDVLLNGIRPR
jgi:TetR/AcrR family transcriptional regulator, cholesterol catabolism regulator